MPWTSSALVSTGADLNRFYLALLAGWVGPEPQLRQMLDGVDMGPASVDLAGLLTHALCD